MTATCQRCGRARPVTRRERLCRTCYQRLWQRGELDAYAPAPLPAAAPLTTRVIPRSVRAAIREAVARGHAQVAVASHYRVSRVAVYKICRKEVAKAT